MAYEFQNLKQSINRNVNTIMPQEEQKEFFSNALIKYLESIRENEHQDEEFQKGVFRDFLKAVIPDKQINVSEKIDLAIYNGNSSESKVGVIIEYKKLDNKSEMMSEDNINTKSFRELVAYYLRERVINKNLEVKRGIITNGYSFFVINSSELEKFFYKNKRLVDNFNKFENRQLASQKTDFLFDEVIAPEIDRALKKKIKIAHFDLNDFLVDDQNIRIKKNMITQLYRFFSSENLLNEMIFADANSLNKNFYNELLYIMGLHEERKNGNKLITRLKEKDRQDVSLVENAIEQLDLKGVSEDRQLDNAIQLVVVWINRILFLKLLESSLISFNKSNAYNFLNYNKLNTFDDINELFFAVMAKKEEERTDRIKKKYPNVPYMNSSLFEPTDLEMSKEGFTINELREGKIQVYSKTKLKDTNGKKLKGKINILEYLFKFLDSYDFTSSGSAKNKKEQGQLINASVLGLIFEKINGYKDGSFFTPGKITMYMAKKALYQSVLTKANEIFHLNIQRIEELAQITRDISFSMEQRRKLSDAIDSLKILDPAVGSGHFLVSILNEIIALKASLRVLFDADGNLLNYISCTVANDELIIQDDYGNNYSYDASKPKSLKIQKALFNQKKKIIENCLYGVDLNPNSVNICRLRLWTELLKNSYYEEDENRDRHLTTLPNIDINIKVGNSLIHRFGLTDNFDLRKSEFKQYTKLIKDYKNTGNKKLKHEINEKINAIKKTFIDSFRTPEGDRFEEALNKLNKVGQGNLFKDFDSVEFSKLKEKADIARKKFENRKNDPFYKDSLEWRIEFPEVLDENGNFEGFDIVIANPPYIFARNQSFDKRTKEYYLKHYEVDEYQANTYTLFMELGFNLLKQNGTFAYIVPNNMLTIQSNQKIRKFLLDHSGDLVIINSLDKIFADASVDNCLVFLKKNMSDSVTFGELINDNFELVGNVDKSFFDNENPMFSISMVKYKEAINIFNKMNDGSRLINVADVKSGIKAYEVGKGVPPLTKEEKDQRIYHSKKKLDDSYLPYIEGKNVNRYCLSWNGEFIKYGNNLAAKRSIDLFTKPRILVRQIPDRSENAIKATFTTDDIINDMNSMNIVNIKVNPCALLGIINSKIETLWFLMKFDKFQRNAFPQFKVKELEQFPIPNMNQPQQEQLASLVNIVLSKASKNENFRHENNEIDELVMDLFGLTEMEKKIVRDFTL